MRLIDADALYDTFERTPWMDNADRDNAEELVESAPTVSPWVKTADRLPTREDTQRIGHYDLIMAMWTDGTDVEVAAVGCGAVTTSPSFYPYWMPVPPLPEVCHVNG